jgi:glycosyltransferase involved in cell wall biosynthesis
MITSAKSTVRQRVLIVAFACHPDVNMETRIGWNRAIASARQYDTTVIHGSEFSSEELSNRAEALGISSSKLRFISVGSWMNKIPDFCDAVYWAGYRAWHDAALNVVTKMHSGQPFHLVHMVSYCGYREPGQWWKLGIPFIWGPIGGTQNFPSKFYRSISIGSSIREAIRNRMNDWQLHRSRRVRLAAQKAHTVLAASTQAQQDIYRGTGVRCVRLLETAVAPIDPAPVRKLDTSRPFRILWSGRLREWKALPLLLEALGQLPASFEFELRVMGVGTSESRWRKIANRLKISEKIQWIGWPAYHEGLQQYSWADAFAFTSLRDTSGTGLLESLAAGTPVIGIDHQGASDIMTPACSIPIPPTDPTAVVKGFQDAILRLAGDPVLWKRLSEGAVQRADFYSWDRLSEQIDAVYRSALPVRFVSDEMAAADANRLAQYYPCPAHST